MIPMSTETIAQAETVTAALRRACDLIDAADVPDPDISALTWTHSPPSVHATWNAETPEELRHIVRSLGSTLESPWRKKLGGEAKVVRYVDNICLTVVAGYAVCSQVQVGETTETVEKVVEPAKTVAVEETVPVLEWRCPESLFADVDAVEVDA